MPSKMKYYILVWNGGKSFEVIMSDGSYRQEADDDRWRYEGKVYGSLGGWDRNRFIDVQTYDKPRYEYMFDPTMAESFTLNEVKKQTIHLIFERFKP